MLDGSGARRYIEIKMSNATATESYNVKVYYTIDGADHTATVQVTIRASQPYTDVSDEADEIIYARHPGHDVEIQDHDISDA